jgi:aryl-alcohol dehydrogenase
MSYYKNLFREDLGGHRRDGSTSLSDDNGPASSHFFGQSSFATYANVVETSVVKIDLSVPLEVVAPLGCDLQTGAGAVLKDVQRRPGSSLAVFGVGAVGSAALIAVRVAGCTTIVALDVYDSRLEPATEFGAPR